jgi:hypothetical protein
MSPAYVGRSPWRLSQQHSSLFSKESAVIERASLSQNKGSGSGEGSSSRLSPRSRQEKEDAEMAWRIMQEELVALETSSAGEPSDRSSPPLRRQAAVSVERRVESVSLSEHDSSTEPVELEMGMTRARQEDISDAICGVFGKSRAVPNSNDIPQSEDPPEESTDRI